MAVKLSEFLELFIIDTFLFLIKLTQLDKAESIGKLFAPLGYL